MVVTDPDLGIMPLTQSITERTRSKVTPTLAEDPLVTPESQEKSTSRNKVKKKDDNKSPTNAEQRAATLKYKKDALAKILADKDEVLEKEKENMAKMTADQETKALEGKEKETEPSEKKRRPKKTRDKDRLQKGLTVDTGEPGDGDAPAVDEAILDADVDDEEWKR